MTEMIAEQAVLGSISFRQRRQGRGLLLLEKAEDVIIAANFDRTFRSAVGALLTIADLKNGKITLRLLNIGSCVGGNAISELTLMILSAIAHFEQQRIGARIADSKAQLIHNGRQLGGTKPFDYELGPHRSAVNWPTLIPNPAKQRAIKTMRKMRAGAVSMMALRDAIRSKGFGISRETVRYILAGGAVEGGA